MLLSWIHQFTRRPSKTCRCQNGVKSRACGRRLGLLLEALEDRTVPSFFTAPTFAVGASPVAQAVGDFNGDGRADLVVANQGSNSVSVLIGNEDGTFAAKTDYAVGVTPIAVAVGDFNGDGKLDIATVNFASKTVSLLLGNGDGTFRPQAQIVLATTPVSLAVGDFNGDNKLDLAIATEDLANDYVNMLQGNGDGTFQAPVSTISDSAPKGIAITLESFSSIGTGDFNGDGRADLVIVNNKDSVSQRSGLLSFGGSVSVMLGNGDGTFQVPQKFAVGVSPRTVAVGDFNGDGRLDFAVGNYLSSTVSVFTNIGGNFSLTTLAPGGAPLSLAAGDFNGADRTELAVSFINAGAVTIYSSQAGGSLQASATYVTGGGFLTTGDLNGDGRPDIISSALPDLVAALVAPANTVSVLLNNGAGTFPAPVLIANPGVPLPSQVNADFNNDGIPDLALAAGEVELGLGDGNFGDVMIVAAGNGVAAADVDGNGTQDLLVTSPSFPPGKLALLLNSPGFDDRTGGAVGFTVSAPQLTSAGGVLSVTVTAVDALGNPVPRFLGTVDLDLQQAGSASRKFEAQYQFTATDNGRHTFLVSNLTNAGVDALSVFAVGMPTASVSVSVAPTAFAKFALTAPASIPAGTTFSLTVVAEDRFGNALASYVGTVHFSALANDTQALLPADYTFAAADAGTHTFTATLFKTEGSSSPLITTKDVATGFASFTNILVTPLAPSSLSMTNLPSPIAAGSQDGVTVTALDVFANPAVSYNGTVHFSSSDARAGLPIDYTFTPIDGGVHSFVPIFETAGTQSFTVADTLSPTFTSSQSGIVVGPGMPAVWGINGFPTNTTAGTVQTFTLTAMDAFGNVATNYLGRVHFSSSDAQAGLPADYTFTAADAGSHTFTTNLKTAGAQSISFADLAIPAFSGTISGIKVNSAAAASIIVAGFPATTAGVAQTFSVTLKDAFGNVATGYTGTVTFGSNDPLASLPANYTFTTADAGIHTFSATLKRAGTQFISVADTVASTLSSTESGINVSAAAVSQFAISSPVNVTQGVGFSITVSAEDAFGNVVAGYRGKVHLSSSDPKAGSQDFTFSNNDNGVHVFSYTLNTLAFQTLTVVDTTNNSIFGSVVVDVLAKNGGSGGAG
jgi:FG-GAP-like repeat/FG-GAP repeat